MSDSHSTEIWLSIPCYEGVYSVSSIGRIRRDSGNCGTHAGLILKPLLKGNRYARVYLWKDGKGTNAQIHALVALAFLGERPEGYTVNHKNGIKFDNRLENLEYMTQAENSRHGREVLGKHHRGERNGNAKINLQVAREIRAEAKTGKRPSAIARQFKMSRTQIVRVIDGEVWQESTVDARPLV